MIANRGPRGRLGEIPVAIDPRPAAGDDFPAAGDPHLVRALALPVPVDPRPLATAPLPPALDPYEPGPDRDRLLLGRRRLRIHHAGRRFDADAALSTHHAGGRDRQPHP